MSFLRVGLVAFILLSGHACKVTTDSTLDTLDNFARAQDAKLSLNQCTGVDNETVEHQEWLDLWFSEAPAKEDQEALIQLRTDPANKPQHELLKSSLRRSLSAVPLNLLTVYFGTRNRVIVSDQANAMCKGEFPNLHVHAIVFASEGTLANPEQFDRRNPNLPAMLEDKSTKVHSCWLYNPGVERLEIWINSEIVTNGEKPVAQSIDHGTVRIFAYVLSQIVAGLDIKNQQADLFGQIDGVNWDIKNYGGIKFEENQVFNRALDELVKLVQQDVARSDGKYDLSIYSNMLADQQVREAFKHYLFADAFDSYYCSRDTRELMTKDFKDTFNFFENEIASALENLTYEDPRGPQSGAIDHEDGGVKLASTAGALTLTSGMQIAQRGRIFRGIFNGLFNLGIGISRFAYNLTAPLVSRGVVLVRGVVHAVSQSRVVRMARVGLRTAAVRTANFFRKAGNVTLGIVQTARHVLIGPNYVRALPGQRW